MNKKTIFLLTILVIISILVIALFAIVKNAVTGNGGKASGQVATPVPTSAYDPPKEIKYDSDTDLRQELETIDPQVLDSDFEE